MEAHTLRDIPRLAGTALVTALRKPAGLLLPASAVLFCLRCAGEVAAAALSVSDGTIAQAAGPSPPLLKDLRWSAKCALYTGGAFHGRWLVLGPAVVLQRGAREGSATC